MPSATHTASIGGRGGIGHRAGVGLPKHLPRTYRRETKGRGYTRNLRETSEKPPSRADSSKHETGRNTPKEGGREKPAR